MESLFWPAFSLVLLLCVAVVSWYWGPWAGLGAALLAGTALILALAIALSALFPVR